MTNTPKHRIFKRQLHDIDVISLWEKSHFFNYYSQFYCLSNFLAEYGRNTHLCRDVTGLNSIMHISYLCIFWYAVIILIGLIFF